MKVLCTLAFFLLMGSTPITDKNYLLGKFEPSTDLRFIRLEGTYASGSATGAFIRKEARDAFVRMAEAAKLEGIMLVIISATRNFDNQKRIWENKWNGRTLVEGKDLTTISDKVERARIILRYSSMPGSSRHHWGTDMDLNSLDNSYFAKGQGLKVYQWLLRHAAEYGFCQPYTSKTTGRTGYEEEKWHWSYLPLSSVFLKDYVKTICDDDLAGFAGSETARSLKIVDEFVQGINCR